MTSVIRFDDLDHTEHAHRFRGADHPDVPFSCLLIHSGPGIGPKVHRHPYAEVFIVDAGEATFRLGEETILVPAGHVVVGPPDVPHGFTNSGSDELRITAIHASPEFVTDWLEGRDPVWAAPPR